ncbi:MAG: CsgG/HfaB family protein [Elusimicrobiota bacterium]
MNRRISLLLAAAALCACATANVAVNRRFDFTKIKRVAVIGFKDYPRVAGSGDIVTGAFEQSLLAAGYDVVEREQVAKVLQEKRFTGSLDPKTAKDLGGLLGVDALLFGQITDLAETKDRMVKVDVVDDRSDPIYVQRSRRVQQPDGTWVETSQEVITGYKTTHIVRKEPRNYTTDGRLGVSARLVYVPTGGVAWSGSDSTIAYSYEDAARGLADDILKAVKSTWPASQK